MGVSIMLTDETKKNIIGEIKTLIGSEIIPEFLNTSHWLELDSGIWLLNEQQYKFIEKLPSTEFYKKIKYAGIFIGKVRKNFGLSMESLYNLQPYIARYVKIRGKTLQKYLYGKTITVTIPKYKIKDLDLPKIIVMTPEEQAVGISTYTILEERKEGNETIISLKLEPITDLGLFLRKERTMFE